jgi:hypothetical protein
VRAKGRRVKARNKLRDSRQNDRIAERQAEIAATQRLHGSRVPRSRVDQRPTCPLCQDVKVHCVGRHPRKKYFPTCIHCWLKLDKPTEEEQRALITEAEAKRQAERDAQPGPW